LCQCSIINFDKRWRRRTRKFHGHTGVVGPRVPVGSFPPTMHICGLRKCVGLPTCLIIWYDLCYARDKKIPCQKVTQVLSREQISLCCSDDLGHKVWRPWLRFPSLRVSGLDRGASCDPGGCCAFGSIKGWLAQLGAAHP
jgi:hypothetical protein